MAEITTEMLADAMSHLQGGGTFRSYISENNVEGIRPPQLRRAFIQNFGVEALQSIMRESLAERMAERWSNMANRFDDVEKIDSMITAINNALVKFQERKSELEAQG
jgi:hypothetical protein